MYLIVIKLIEFILSTKSMFYKGYDGRSGEKGDKGEAGETVPPLKGPKGDKGEPGKLELIQSNYNLEKVLEIK